MRRLLPLLVLGCSHPAPAPAPAPARDSSPAAAPARTRPTASGPGRVIEADFHSAALGVSKHYVAYLPGGYDAGAQRYPVIYLLHGLGGDESSWVEHGDLAAVADGLNLPAIVVMPDGDDSFYANSVTPPDYQACLAGRRAFGFAADMRTYCVKQGAYEDYIVRDLVAHVDATYRTIAAREGRGIAGLSMGGYGALVLGMRHKDVYAAAASHSGVDALLYAGPHPYAKGQVQLADDPSVWGAKIEPLGAHVRAIFGPDLANWRAHDPAWLATQLSDGEIALYLDCGTEDDFLLHDGAQYLHDLLVERGVKHEWYLGPGRHNFAFWRDRLDDSLRFFVAALVD